MGLKWFRARLTMSRMPKNTSSTQGFYRSMSQFDCDVNVQPSEYRENRIEPSIHTVTTSAGPIAVNPMAALNSRENEAKVIRRDNETTPTGSNANKEPIESPEDSIVIPRNLPRESIEIMRSGSAEGSPRQIDAKSRKADFKKKKAKAPLPKTAGNTFIDDNRRFVSLDKGRSSDGSEIEI